MLKPSVGFRKVLAENPVAFEPSGRIYFADGIVINVTGEDFMDGTFEFSYASSTDSSFDIGTVAVPSFHCVLNNVDGKFDEYDFTGARIYVQLNVTTSANVTIALGMSSYVIEQPDVYGDTIDLQCLGKESYYQKPFSEINVPYNSSGKITLSEFTRSISYQCGYIFYSVSFPNSSYVINRADVEANVDSNMTCQQMLSYIAQIAGCFCGRYPWGSGTGASIDSPWFTWYDRDWKNSETWLDGGTYDTDTIPYSDGDTAEGGAFMTGGDTVEGGAFTIRSYASITKIFDLTVATDDVVITGLRVTAYDDDNGEGESVLYGSEGYVLHIEGNPLIVRGKAQTIADFVGPRVVGMRFRPFEATISGDPTLQPGDPVVITDGKGRQYESWITSHEYSGATSHIKCAAETPARHTADVYSAMAAAIIANKKAIVKEKTARETAIEDLEETMENAGGLYTTKVPDGTPAQGEPQAYKYYLHNHPTLAQSTIVWEMTADAFAVSVDGGQSYTAGLTATGNAILQRIYAVGIDADYINTGCITVEDPTTHDVLFRADVDLAEVSIGGFTVDATSLVGSTISIDPTGISFIDSGTESGKIWYTGTLVDLVSYSTLRLSFENLNLSARDWSTGGTTYDTVATYTRSTDSIRIHKGINHATLTDNCTIEGDGTNKIGNWVVKSLTTLSYGGKTGRYDKIIGGVISPSFITLAYGNAIDDDSYPENTTISIGQITMGYGNRDRMLLNETNLYFYTYSNSTTKYNSMRLNNDSLRFFDKNGYGGYISRSSVGAGECIRIAGSNGVQILGGVWVGDYANPYVGASIYHGATGYVNYTDNQGYATNFRVINGIIVAI